MHSTEFQDMAIDVIFSLRISFVFGVVFLLNLFLIGAESSGAVPFGENYPRPFLFFKILLFFPLGYVIESDID